MHWNLYDLPPEITDEQPRAADVMDDPDSPELEAAHDFPTLTDCPYCGSRKPDECGCFD